MVDREKGFWHSGCLSRPFTKHLTFSFVLGNLNNANTSSCALLDDITIQVRIAAGSEKSL